MATANHTTELDDTALANSIGQEILDQVTPATNGFLLDIAAVLIATVAASIKDQSEGNGDPGITMDRATTRASTLAMIAAIDFANTHTCDLNSAEADQK